MQIPPYNYIYRLEQYLDLLELMLVLLRDLNESPLLVTFLPLTEKFLSLYSSSASILPGKLAPRVLALGTPNSPGKMHGEGDLSEGLLDNSP